MAENTSPPAIDLPDSSGGELPLAPRKSITIGAVCKALEQEFPDISISKIRYLEDEKLVTPRRTPGGYRQYTPNDVQRLRTILRMQRDEFLPLRVIRQELAGGQGNGALGESRGPRRTFVAATASGASYTLDEVVEDTGAEPELINELVEFGVIKGEMNGGKHCFDDTEREIVRAVSELARYGVGGRNLRVFRSSADREAQLLQSILAPMLRSRNPERRKEALQALESLATVTTHLKHLLLIRDLRKIAG